MNLMNHKDIRDQSNLDYMGVDGPAPSAMIGRLSGSGLTMRQRRLEAKAPARGLTAVVKTPLSLGPFFQLLSLVTHILLKYVVHMDCTDFHLSHTDCLGAESSWVRFLG